MQKNRIELAGYLVTKPEARFLPSGTKVANARLKESYRFTGTDGKQQTHANWHSLVFYGELADVALAYEKDDNVYIEGSLQQRKFTPADGVSRTVYEVHARSCHQIASFDLGREEQPNGNEGSNPDVYAAFEFGGIRVNASASLPIGLYRTTSDKSGKAGRVLSGGTPCNPFHRAWLSPKRDLPRRSGATDEANRCRQG